MKTYGEITTTGGFWQVRADPHVAIRLKRIFGGASTTSKGLLLISRTPSASADLQWVLSRWPMRMSEEVSDLLTGQAGKYADGKEAIYKILSGERLRDLGNEPVRVPWQHQIEASDIVLTTGALLIGDDLGLGKTLSTLLTLRNPAAMPALVVTMTHLTRQWQDELRFAYPWMRSHILAGTRPYDISRKMRGKHPDVIITNYHKLDGWAHALAGQIKTVIFDEMQELRHSDSKKYKAAQHIAGEAVYRVGATATPVYNYGIEMFNILDVLFPGGLGTRHEFVREWCTERGGKVYVDDPAAFGSYLREEGFFLRRTRRDVGKELPEALRIPYAVDADDAPLDDLDEELTRLAETVLSGDDHKEVFTASGDLDWQLRQATGIAKARHVAEHVKLILESEEKIVLFGWHRAVYDIWLKHLETYRPVLYTGSETDTQKREAVERFIEGDSRILIMSLRSGAGLNGLEKVCRTAVFGELDWSPAQHEQCVGRLRRGEITEPVTAYFFVSQAGSDPLIAETLNIKRMQAEPMRDPDADTVQVAQDNSGRIKRLAEQFLARKKPARV